MRFLLPPARSRFRARWRVCLRVALSCEQWGKRVRFLLLPLARARARWRVWGRSWAAGELLAGGFNGVAQEHGHSHRADTAGTGVIAAATCDTESKSTSPTVLTVSQPAASCVLTRLIPTSMTNAPGLTSSAVMSPGRPAATTSKVR